MKLTKTLILFAVTAILISSCGSLSITQKRYSNGLNINWFSKKDAVVSKTAKKRKTDKETILAGNSEFTDQNTAPVNEQTKTESLTYTPVSENAVKVDANKTSKKSIFSSPEKTDKSEKGISKISKKSTLSKFLKPGNIDKTAGNGLATVGWFLIILGLIFLLLISLIVGLLVMLVGLLFVVAGKL